MKYTALGWFVSAAAMLASAVAQGSTVDALIADLAGNDEVARSRARLLLPREDIVAATVKVVALVRQDNEAVWHTAFNVLMDFAAAVSVPGREAERAEVTGQLMTLITPQQPEAVKERGLRLLPLIVPAGYDVGPMAALLDDSDPILQEKARAALQETGTPEAAAALRAYLPKARPAFQCAILHSLGELKDAGSLKAFEELTRSPDAKVRAAAALAMAWTGDPVRLAAVKAVVAAADEATRKDAADALIRLASAIEAKGGNREIAVANYREWLDSPDRVMKEAGLAGLGRIGDGSCVAPVLAAIREAEAPTWQVGVDALGRMQGVDVARALAAEYPKQPAKLQPALLEALGSKRNPIVLPVLIEAAKSQEASFRMAAASALGESGLPGAVLPLAEAAAAAKPPEDAAARAAIRQVAASLRSDGKNKEAGQAYLAALQSAKNEDERRPAIEGLIACPAPEALQVLQAEAEWSAESKKLGGPIARALVAVGGSLNSAGQKKEAITAFETARKLDSSPELTKLIAAGMREAGAAGDYAARMGLVTHWWVVGPFELARDNAGWNMAYVGEPDVSLTARYMTGKRRIEWQPAKAVDEHGVVDLQKSIARGDNLIGYAYTELTVERDTNALLLLGVDDSERVWVNGERVFELFMPRPMTPDQDKIPIRLKAGKNAILMKIWQNSMGWEFCARLTAPDGKPITFTQQAK